MKKTLLLGMAAMFATSAVAATDGGTYAPSTVGDVTIECKNLWSFDRNRNLTEFEGDAFFGKESNSAPSALLMPDGTAYIGSSAAGVGSIIKVNALTGEVLGKVAMTLDGAPYAGTLVANTFTSDNFGHIIVKGADLQTAFTAENPMKPAPIYTVDPETGVMTLVATLERGQAGRMDYVTVIGDVTGVEAECIIMGSQANEGWIHRWKREKGGESFVGDFEGAAEYNISDFYVNPPEEGAIAAFGSGSIVKILEGEADTQFAGELFYVDGTNTQPTMYDNYGGIVDGFEGVGENCYQDDNGANGVIEFAIKDRKFLAYANRQHTGDFGNNIKVSEFAVGDPSLANRTYLWTLPHDGMNPAKTSDGGRRYHPICVNKMVDNAGKEGVLLFHYKAFAGMGAYLIAEEGFVMDQSGVEGVEGNKAVLNVANGVITTNEAADIEVYNVAGQKVVAAEGVTSLEVAQKGAYIVKANVAGENIVKKVVF